MICYRDQTWCTEHECKHSETCFRYLTEEHKGKAEMLKLDICQWLDRPQCFEERER